MRCFRSTVLAVAAAASIIILNAQEPSSGPSRRTQLTLGTGSGVELREWDSRLNQLARSGELQQRSVRADTVLGGDRVHERYDQYYKGVRVFGGDVVREVNAGLTVSVFGTLHNDVNISTEPTVSHEGAIRHFAQLSKNELPPAFDPELVILPRDEGGYALTWRAHVWTEDGWMHTFLDARTGGVALQYNDLQTQAAVGTGTGVLGDRKKISTLPSSGRFLTEDHIRPPRIITYDMQGNYSRTSLILSRWILPTTTDIASDADNVWNDPAVVDGHVYLGWTYDFLFQRFGRRGLDDRDVPLRVLMHPVHRSDIYTIPRWAEDFYVNAGWYPDTGPGGQGIMLFGEGLPAGWSLRDGTTLNYFAGALDIVSHEMTHGLTNYSSELVYRNESGALNEAFSDIIATSVEFFYQPAGSGAQKADYLLGEDISNPPTRSLADPAAFSDPDHYSRRYVGSLDGGGVHSNSGIPNHAFYLAIEGGANRTSGMRVEGVGAANRDQIEKVFYRAFVNKLTSTATFSMARAATIDSAREQYGAGSAAERAVTQAWDAVGVR